MNDIDLSTLNPGIRKTVEFLRSNGFDTIDSGDGETRTFDCDLGIPYVHIQVDPDKLVSETKRLAGLLKTVGVEVLAQNEEGTAPTIEGSFEPVSNLGIISMFNIKLT